MLSQDQISETRLVVISKALRRHHVISESTFTKVSWSVCGHFIKKPEEFNIDSLLWGGVGGYIFLGPFTLCSPFFIMRLFS